MSFAHLVRTKPAWIDPAPVPADFPLDTLHAHPLVARLLYGRGLRDAATARAFVDRAPRPAPSAHLLPNMDRAVEWVGRAIERGERIGVFGDYDVDGVTSTAVLAEALGHAAGHDRVVACLPERSEGYGLSHRALTDMDRARVGLLITVDCGSSDHERVAAARRAGMDVIILDHHRMADSGPEGAITVSPQLLADGPYHELTAVGVAYLLVSALAQHGYDVSGPDHDETGFLDLVALGTVADVAPLTGVNRALVRDGLAALRRTHRPGLHALFRQAGVTPDDLDASTIAFKLAPRLNAAGRMASPRLAFDLLRTGDVREAERLAAELEQINVARRIKTDLMMEEATGKVLRLRDWQELPVIVLTNPRWETGLLGAVASRLTEELQRPVFMLREDDGIAHGSGRSVEGFNLIEALNGAASLLVRHGGHSLAAGVTLPRVNVTHLTEHLQQAVAQTDVEIPAPRILALDADLDAGSLSMDTLRALDALQPFGQGNAQPLFRVAGAKPVRYRTIGQDNRHLRITVQTGSRQLDAVHWGAGWRSSELVMRGPIDLAGKLEINRWNGQERLQMVLEDFRTE